MPWDGYLTGGHVMRLGAEDHRSCCLKLSELMQDLSTKLTKYFFITSTQAGRTSLAGRKESVNELRM